MAAAAPVPVESVTQGYVVQVTSYRAVTAASLGAGGPTGRPGSRATPPAANPSLQAQMIIGQPVPNAYRK